MTGLLQVAPPSVERLTATGTLPAEIGNDAISHTPCALS